MLSFVSAASAWSEQASSSPGFAERFFFQHPSSAASGGTCLRKVLKWLDLGSINHYSQLTACSEGQHLLSQTLRMG